MLRNFSKSALAIGLTALSMGELSFAGQEGTQPSTAAKIIMQVSCSISGNTPEQVKACMDQASAAQSRPSAEDLKKSTDKLAGICGGNGTLTAYAQSRKDELKDLRFQSQYCVQKPTECEPSDKIQFDSDIKLLSGPTQSKCKLTSVKDYDASSLDQQSLACLDDMQKSCTLLLEAGKTGTTAIRSLDKLLTICGDNGALTGYADKRQDDLEVEQSFVKDCGLAGSECDSAKKLRYMADVKLLKGPETSRCRMTSYSDFNRDEMGSKSIHCLIDMEASCNDLLDHARDDAEAAKADARTSGPFYSSDFVKDKSARAPAADVSSSNPTSTGPAATAK